MKRLFDVVSSIYGLVVLSPILLITALLIKMESPGPAIFKCSVSRGFEKFFK